jgi:large subunit ribosomal protein L24
MSAKLKTNDVVVVLTGRDKGKTGKVSRVFPKEGRALVQGIQLVQRHTRKTETSEGGILTKEAPIDLSNLAFVDKDGKPTRVGFKILETGEKVRYAKRSGEVIDG